MDQKQLMDVFPLLLQMGSKLESLDSKLESLVKTGTLMHGTLLQGLRPKLDSNQDQSAPAVFTLFYSLATTDDVQKIDNLSPYEMVQKFKQRGEPWDKVCAVEKLTRAATERLRICIDTEEAWHSIKTDQARISSILDLTTACKLIVNGFQVEVTHIDLPRLPDAPRELSPEICRIWSKENDVIITRAQHTASQLILSCEKESDALKLDRKGKVILSGHLGNAKAYDQRSRVRQCYKCQRYGHFESGCTYLTRCGFCSGPHRSAGCPNRNAIKCPNCSLEHVAWSPRCRDPNAVAERKACEKYRKQGPHWAPNYSSKKQQYEASAPQPKGVLNQRPSYPTSHVGRQANVEPAPQATEGEGKGKGKDKVPLPGSQAATVSTPTGTPHPARTAVPPGLRAAQKRRADSDPQGSGVKKQQLGPSPKKRPPTNAAAGQSTGAATFNQMALPSDFLEAVGRVVLMGNPGQFAAGSGAAGILPQKRGPGRPRKDAKPLPVGQSTLDFHSSPSSSSTAAAGSSSRVAPLPRMAPEDDIWGLGGLPDPTGSGVVDLFDPEDDLWEDEEGDMVQFAERCDYDSSEEQESLMAPSTV